MGRPPIYATPTVKRSFRIPSRLEGRAARRAAREGRSLSQWIFAAMALALKHPAEMKRELRRLDEKG